MSRLPPSVEITSPTNTTYSRNNIQFTHTTDNFDDYSFWLDDIQDNTITSGSNRNLGEGTHNFTIKLTNTANTILKSILFTIDVTIPTITITSPNNATYASDDVTLTYSVSEPASIMVFLDEINEGSIVSGGTLSNLPDGCHNLTLQAIDAAGNAGTSTVWFTTEFNTPTITITSPSNTTYISDSITVVYTLSESATVSGFLNGLALGSISSNTPLSGLSETSYNLTLQAVDGAGNIGVTTVWFTIDVTAPTITITSPTNSTYLANSVTLTYTISETASILVFLDGTNKGIITSGGTLSNLPDGCHNLTLQAIDAAGNAGTVTIWLTIMIEPTTTTIPTIITTSTTTTTQTTTTKGSSPDVGGVSGFTLITAISMIAIILVMKRASKSRKML